MYHCLNMQELKCLEEKFEVKVEYLEKKLLSAEENVKKLLLENKGNKQYSMS